MKETTPEVYKTMVQNKSLSSSLNSIQDAYNHRAAILQSRMENEQGVDQTLFRTNKAEWFSRVFKIQLKIRE